MQTQTNTAGVAGFVLAVVSFFSMGILAPIALVVSVAGLGREPKGLAVAGSVLAGLQCLVVLLVVLSFSGALVAGSAFFSALANRVESESSELESPSTTATQSTPTSIDKPVTTPETPIKTARSIVMERVMAISPGVLIRIDSEAAFQAAMGPAVRLEGRANSVGESRLIQAVLVNVGGQWQIAELKIGADTVARDLGLLAGIE